MKRFIAAMMASVGITGLAGATTTIAYWAKVDYSHLVFDSLGNPNVYGQGIHMAQSGLLSQLTWTIVNGSSLQAQSIITATETVKFYNNAVPYVGGSLDGTLPLIGSASFNIDFRYLGPQGLKGGGFALEWAEGPLDSLGIVLPQDIFVTYQLTLTSGTATAAGMLIRNDVQVGSASPILYRNTTNYAEGLYTNPIAPYLEMQIELSPVPEPEAWAVFGLGALVFLRRRRRVSR